MGWGRVKVQRNYFPSRKIPTLNMHMHFSYFENKIKDFSLRFHQIKEQSLWYQSFVLAHDSVQQIY